MADIIVKGSEKVLLLQIREGLVYQSVVPNWLDLRIGAYISATQAAANDDPSALSETLTTTGLEEDRLWIGFKDNGSDLPRSAPFFGIANSPAVETSGSSVVESIDTNFRWRSKYATSPVGLVVNDGTAIAAETSMQPARVIQDPSSLSGNYATLIMLRMVRSSVGNTIDHFYVAKSTSGGTDYADSGVESDTPTKEEIRENFRSAVFTEVLSAKTFTSVPDSFYAYWPFNNSRLRIHSIVVEKFS
jgi:hypothetical protein